MLKTNKTYDAPDMKVYEVHLNNALLDASGYGVSLYAGDNFDSDDITIYNDEF